MCKNLTQGSARALVRALQELSMQTAVVIDLGEGERGDCASLLSILHHGPIAF